MATLAVITLSTPIFAAVIIPIAFVYYFVQRFYVSCPQTFHLTSPPAAAELAENLIKQKQLKQLCAPFRWQRAVNSSDWSRLRDRPSTRTSQNPLPALRPFELTRWRTGEFRDGSFQQCF